MLSGHWNWFLSCSLGWFISGHSPTCSPFSPPCTRASIQHIPKLWSHHTNLHFWKTMYSLTPGLLQKHFPRPDTFFPKLLLTWLIPMHPWSLTVAVNTSRKPSLASKCSWVGPFAWLPPPPGPLQLLMPYLGTACSLQTGRPRQWSVISPPSLTHAWLLTLINRF